MRLRTFTGRSSTEAMAAVRVALGPDAVIISAQDDGAGNTRVTAALDEAHGAAAEAPPIDAIIGKALAFHGIAASLHAKLLDGVRAAPCDTPLETLAASLGGALRFAPLGPQDRAILLVGAPGSGKSITAAKLATRDVLAGKRVRLIGTDLARAGGAAQLAAFAKILDVPFVAAESPVALGALIARAEPQERLIIDSASVNPFNAGNRREIAALIGASTAEPVLVFAAGGEATDGAERAQIFADLGCTRAIVTQLDATRRLGSVLAVAESAGLAFAEGGIAPDIADGLMPLTPTLLARLLLPKGSP